VNGTLFFSADDGTSGTELWKSDGTAAGTVLVLNIDGCGCSSDPSSLTNVNGTLFFAADDGPSGTELWKSDGTAAGTVRVLDIYAGSRNSIPHNLTNVNGMLFFAALNGSSGNELWKSDGTAAGTVRVQDIYAGSGDSDPFWLTNVNGRLFFQAYDGITGTELWNATLAPTLTMRGNSQPIDAASSTPTVTNNTDFGSSRVGQALVHSFTITNTGDAALALTGNPPVTLSGAAAGDFSVTQAPITPLAPGGSTTIAITFRPSAPGIRSATVSIASNASSTNPFTFAIQGTGGQQFGTSLPLVLR
jgi:ELWxxDGT repeat protein